MKQILTITFIIFINILLGCEEKGRISITDVHLSQKQIASLVTRKPFESQRYSCIDMHENNIGFQNAIEVTYTNQCGKLLNCRVFIYYVCRANYNIVRVLMKEIGRLQYTNKFAYIFKFNGCKQNGIIKSHKVLCQ